jgi:hypothetical protein
MVTIEVDEAFAFDFLSIAAVKEKKKLNGAKEQLAFYYDSLEFQLGIKFHDIIKSEEYKELIRLNEEIYDKLEIIRKNHNLILASVIDELNSERYEIKKKLQFKYFNEDIKEVKSNERR